MSSASVAVPVTRTSRVCGTSASSAPSVTMSSQRVCVAMSSTASQNAFHRRLGSTPRKTTRSRCARDTEKHSLAGHEIERVTPSTSSTVGRRDWKSKWSSGSMWANRVAS